MLNLHKKTEKGRETSDSRAGNELVGGTGVLCGLGGSRSGGVGAGAAARGAVSTDLHEVGASQASGVGSVDDNALHADEVLAAGAGAQVIV